MSALAYTYEADVHCVECARERFGDALDFLDSAEFAVDDPRTPRDREGNVVWLLGCEDETFDPATCSHGWESGPFVVGCSTCSAVIAGQAAADDPLYEGGDLAELREQWRLDREASLQRTIEELGSELREITDTRAGLVEAFDRFVRGLGDLDEVLRALDHEGAYVESFHFDSRPLRLAAELRGVA